MFRDGSCLAQNACNENLRIKMPSVGRIIDDIVMIQVPQLSEIRFLIKLFLPYPEKTPCSHGSGQELPETGHLHVDMPCQRK